MTIFSQTLLNLICILFPLSIYVIGMIYSKNLDLKIKDLFLEITLYSSLYLVIKYNTKENFIYSLALLNIPLLIAYLKRKPKIVVIISIILIIYYNSNIKIGYFYLIIEYLIYYLIFNSKVFKFDKYKLVNIFVLIKSFILSFEIFYFLRPNSSIMNNLVIITIVMVLFIFLTYLIIYLLTKSEEIIDLNNIVHELEKEKTLRNSLFKITHEIKNPIAVCKGYLDMMDYKDIKKVERYNSIIKDEINRTLILMDDFLDYTKIKIEKDETDLYMLVEDTCDVVKPLFKKADINFKTNIPDSEIYMNLDYNRLKQVLVNLIKNSIESVDRNKTNNYVFLTVKKSNNFINISIKDNGVGMDKDTLEHVSDMFYTTKDKGTGLGVSLSKEIIELHNGTIKYLSSKGKYTIVNIKLPLIN